MKQDNRLFLFVKQRLISECAAVNPDGIRFNCIEYLCSFRDIDPVEMAADLQNDGHTILFDDSSISRAENQHKKAKVQAEARRLVNNK